MDCGFKIRTMIPIFLVADGRSGTTFLMRLLASHPEIVAYEKYPLEFRPALFSLYPDYPVMRDMLGAEWRFEGNRELFYDPVKAHGVLTAENVAKIYAAIAREAHKQPSHFAEKCPIGLDFGLIIERYSKFRCLLLVRDPRDVILSVRAFNRKRGTFALREKEGYSVEDLMVEYRRGYVHIMSKMSSIKDAHLVRYEDIASNTGPILTRLFDWLGVDASDKTLRECTLRAASMENGNHRTSASLEASVERWRNEMPADWHELFAKHFGSILPYFGYSDK